MIKTCHSKDGGNYIFCWPFMGRDWVDVELLYNSVHRKFREFWRSESWKNDVVEKTSTQRGWAPGPGWRVQEYGKETLMAIRVGGHYAAVLFGLQLPLTHNPFNKVRGIFFLKDCVVLRYWVVVMILHASASEYTTIDLRSTLIRCGNYSGVPGRVIPKT